MLEYLVVHINNKRLPLLSFKQTKPFAECWQKDVCGQMRSCEEAYYFLEHCQKTKLDGNKNGIPCESLCAKLH
jgi:hypothetical protein